MGWSCPYISSVTPRSPWSRGWWKATARSTSTPPSSGASPALSPLPALWSTPLSHAWKDAGGVCWRRTTSSCQWCPEWWRPAASCTTSVRTAGTASYLSGTLTWLPVQVIWNSQTQSHVMEATALLRSSETPSPTTFWLYCSTEATGWLHDWWETAARRRRIKEIPCGCKLASWSCWTYRNTQTITGGRQRKWDIYYTCCEVSTWTWVWLTPCFYNQLELQWQGINLKASFWATVFLYFINKSVYHEKHGKMKQY